MPEQSPTLLEEIQQNSASPNKIFNVRYAIKAIRHAKRQENTENKINQLKAASKNEREGKRIKLADKDVKIENINMFHFFKTVEENMNLNKKK